MGDWDQSEGSSTGGSFYSCDLGLLNFFEYLIRLNYFQAKSWGFTPHPTKEDCSSYPPWILQDAPSEVTCISYWSHTPIKIA